MRAAALVALAFGAVDDAVAQTSQTTETVADAVRADGATLSMEDAVALGRARSFRIARAMRQQESADLREESAHAAFFPRAELNINTSQAGRAYSYHDNQSNSANSNSYADFQGGVSLYASVPIDISGVLSRQVNQAELQQTVSGNAVLDAVLDVSLEIRLNYIEALRAQSAVEVDESIVARLEALAARAPQSVAPFLQIELANARQGLSSSRTDADLAMESVRNSLRLEPDTQLTLTTQLNQMRPVFEREGLLETALANRPDVRQIELRVEQARLGASQVDDYRRPSLRVSGYYNAGLYGEYFFEPEDGRNESGGITLGLNVPLGQWDNGNLRRQRERASLDIEQAQADAVEHRETVAQELRQVLISLDRAEQRLLEMPDEREAYRGMLAAERNLLAASGDEASALIAQTSNARAAWRAAQLSAVNARIDYYRAAFRLIHALGLEPEPGSYTGTGETHGSFDADQAEIFAAVTPSNGGPKGLMQGDVERPGAGTDTLVLRPIDLRDAPSAAEVRVATQRSEIAPTPAPTGPPHSNRQSRFGRLVSFVFGARPRTVVWE